VGKQACFLTFKENGVDFLVLVGQRKQRYEGEYAPEALAVIDDVGNDDNPDYMREEFAKQHKSGEFSALAVVRLRADSAAINNALFPASGAIPAEVIAE
jgi:hypothetical protein